MDSRRRIRPVPMIAESAIIIASILAAFGIDAWWERYSQRETIRAYNEQLFTQMSRNRSELADAQDRFSRALESMRALEEAILPRPEALDGDSVAALLGVSMFMDPALLETGALDAILSQGDLAQPGEVQLQNWMIAFRQVADYQREHTIADEARERVLDRFIELAPLSYFGGATDPSVDFPLPVLDVLSDRTLESRIRNLFIRLSRVQSWGANLIEIADSILARLQSETT